MTNSPPPDAIDTLQSMFFNPALRAEPFSLFEQLRSMGSVIRIPMPFAPQAGTAWLVTRFAEAVQVLRDRRFTMTADAAGERRTENEADLPGFLRGRTMVNVDAPDHTRLRTLVSKAFTPRYVESLRPRIQQLADALLDPVEAAGHMDLVRDYAFPLPVIVISEMLGVPPEDREQIRVWSESVTGGSPADPDWVSRMTGFTAYLRRLVAEKRRRPQDDLISQLVEIEEAGDRLSEQELVDMVSLLIFAGHETTSNLIAIGMLTLLERPQALEELKADPGLIPAAVEELLRFSGPVMTIAPRRAAEDVEIGGQPIRKGESVLILIASANRDPAQFEEADRLSVARRSSAHVAFGQGVHYCLGAPLARLEAAIAFATLLRRMPGLRLRAGRETPAWRGDLFLRGLASLPVSF